MVTEVDIYVGKRLRLRRRLLGMIQADLAKLVNCNHKQIQKYEGAKNRLTASQLFALSTALGVNVDYFFEGLAPNEQVVANDRNDIESHKGAIELVRYYSKLHEQERRHLLEFGKHLSSKSHTTSTS